MTAPVLVVDGKKLCGRCCKSQPVSNFNKDRTTPSGFRPICKSCRTMESIEYNLTLKIDALQAYSKGAIMCASCKISDIDVLTIDHVNNDGYIQKKQLGGAGSKLYRWLKHHNYPMGYQVLCYNCNMKKALYAIRFVREN